MSDIWEERERQFEALISRSDEFSNDIGTRGKAYAAQQREREEKREHDESVYGRD